MNETGEMKGPTAKAAEAGVATKVVLFAPPFFLLDSKNVPGYLESNRKLLAHFLKLKADYPHMYILTQSTAMNKMIGNCIAGQASSMPLLNMLEPTYVLYPFVRVEETPNPENPFEEPVKVARGGIVFSAAAANEALLPVSNLPSRIASPSVYIQKGERGTIAYLPNPKVEDGALNKMYPPLKLRFYGEGAEVLHPEHVRRFIVQASPAAVASDIEGVKQDIFQGAAESDLALDDMTYTRVPLDGRVYSFRAPGSPGVIDDWKGMRFTSDEADFLNQLQLRPNLLLEIFKDDAGMGPSIPERLAAFLQNMAIGRCFTDERMLTASECQESRDFVNRVYNYYLMHDERLEELKEAEEDARKRMTRLRIETADDRMRIAQDAEREKRQEYEAQLKHIRDNASFVGIDMERPSEDYEKNPMDANQGPVRKPIKRGDTVMEPSESLEKKGQFEIQVIVFKRKTGEYWIGIVDFQAEEGEDSSKKASMILEGLNKAYPGYYIMQDFN